MDFIKLCAFSIISSALLLLISNREKELSNTIAATVFITVVIYTITRINDALKWLTPYLESISVIDTDIILKILGIDT